MDSGSSILGGSTIRKSLALSTAISQHRLQIPASEPSDGIVKFPRVDECVHFHYETVECGGLELVLQDGPLCSLPSAVSGGACEFENPEQVFWITVKCKGKEWVIRRMMDQFKDLDELLHQCIYDRKFTQLRRLHNVNHTGNKELHDTLKKYVARLSQLPVERILCAPVLHWFGIDNKGTKLAFALGEIADINIPAIAAAHAIRRYTAQSSDELSLEVGDMVSIIGMTDPHWWRGKCRLQVGLFPAQCVRRISDAKRSDDVNPPPSLLNPCDTKPIAKKHGRFMEFLRSFVVTRPTKSRLKQTGILKERVFGCDLGEYLHNCGDDVPVIVRDCLEFVEKYGIVDGIYRISGITSHVQKLRHEYDCERRPSLNGDQGNKEEQSFCDPHSVAGLCKLYFRELPNPLLTYQLYDRFASAINEPEDKQLLKIHDVIQQLPPPHYRTLKHLALHLQNMSRHNKVTSMHCRNLAIVWAPNLLRSRELEAGTAAFQEARVQSVVTEFLIANADTIFSGQLQNIQLTHGQRPPRPKSLMVLFRPNLISLEEAQARSKAGGRFSEQSGENLAGSVNKEDMAIPATRRSRKMSSPAGYPLGNSRTSSPTKPVTPISSGGLSFTAKRRQSMDPKYGSTHEQSIVPRSPQYSSQHATGWKSRLSSFLKKGTLRKSQSDDSLLSSHSAAQNQNKDEDALKSSEMVASLDPLTFCQHDSQKSVGLVYKWDKSSSPEECTSAPSEVTTVRNTPNSIPAPSVESEFRNHNPFFGLDSGFPGVMGEAGLGFNPFQFNSTFLSDLNTPEQSRTPEDFVKKLIPGTKSAPKTTSTVNIGDNEKELLLKPIGIMTTEQVELPVSVQTNNTCDSATNKKENLGSDVPAVEEGFAKYKCKSEEFDSVFNVSSSESNVNNNNLAEKFSNLKSAEVHSTAARHSRGWNTDEIDGVIDSTKLKLKVQRGSEKSQAASLNLPQTNGYLVQYSSNHQDSNGKIKRSITATFVKDRPVDSKLHRPHSIRRCMDVPPTDIAHTSAKRLSSAQHRRQHHSMRDVTRRNKAYAAWVSQQHQVEVNLGQNRRPHCSRSLSVREKLDFGTRPVPAPRSRSFKPVPMPRRLHGNSEKCVTTPNMAQIHSHVVSKPSTLIN